MGTKGKYFIPAHLFKIIDLPDPLVFGSYEDDPVMTVVATCDPVEYFVGHDADGKPVYESPGKDDDVVFKDSEQNEIQRIPLAAWPCKAEPPDYVQIWIRQKLMIFRNVKGGVVWQECDGPKIVRIDGDLMVSNPLLQGHVREGFR